MLTTIQHTAQIILGLCILIGMAYGFYQVYREARRVF